VSTPKNDWNSSPQQTSFGYVVELLIDRLGIGVVYRTPILEDWLSTNSMRRKVPTLSLLAAGVGETQVIELVFLCTNYFTKLTIVQ
jgi:hypothetical protein